ncbi:MAG: AlpA family phage regulatory protein [Pseudomonadota bacterium]
MNQFIREPECFKITGLSRTTRWRLEKRGEFPKRCKISQNIIGWLASDLDTWISSKKNNGSNVGEASYAK